MTDDEVTNMPPSTYRVPGAVFVEYDPNTGKTRTTFTPSAGGAGYFGPAAELWEGANVLSDEELTDSFGPFWRGVQQELRDNDYRIAWEE